MKLLKIKVNIDRREGSTHYTYPQPHYDMLRIVFGPIYEGGRIENLPDIWARGSKESSYEYILVGVENNLRVQDALQNPDIEEILDADCLVLGNKWMGQEEKISDSNKVTLILAKSARGETLTQDEINALDPNHKELGINKTASFEETLEKYKKDFPN